MAMTPFYTRFGNLAFEETRVVILQGSPDLPDGEYGFLELYCDEPECDCRRVLIHVVSKATGPRIWATINYGWETADYYYSAWMRDKKLARLFAGARLDPLNPQTQYAEACLKLFKRMLKDRAYVDRLKRHYQMFKDQLKREAGLG